MFANSVEKNIWKEGGGSVNRMEVLRNLSSLHAMTVRIHDRCEMEISKQKQHLGDKNVDGKIILQWVLRVHLQNIIRVIKSRMNCESSLAETKCILGFGAETEGRRQLGKTYAHMGG